MWELVAESLDADGVIEYGMFQLESVAGTPLWRRHQGRGKHRFVSLRNALFGEQGVRNACLGSAPYPKTRYSATGRLIVPYAAAWIAGSNIAVLAHRTSADPEITLVSPQQLPSTEPASSDELSDFLTHLFAEGAARFGVRTLSSSNIVEP
jgi:hypothetical protein